MTLRNTEFNEEIEMIEITAWTNTFLNALNDCFGDRVWFVGQQGSFARGEATENSKVWLRSHLLF